MQSLRPFRTSVKRGTLAHAIVHLLAHGQNVANPVLQSFSGGPGGSELAMVRHNLAPLESRFTIVVWEKRGAGKSYATSPAENITAGQLESDAARRPCPRRKTCP